MAYYGFQVPPPPQWENAGGGEPSFFEQGVYNPEGNWGGKGSGKMKMVGLGPSLGLGETPLYEGEKGLMQCGVNPSTGETMTDAKGNARCWYTPVAAGTFARTGGQAAMVDTEMDIVHYGGGMQSFPFYPQPAPMKTVLPPMNYKPVTQIWGANRTIYSLSLATLAAFLIAFAYRVYIVKRVNAGDEPGVLGKLVMPETWKLWGNKYGAKRTSEVYEAE